ncbi:MAG TPA: hypothetical protein VEK57_19265 [Thermoanaerobaculia bacterium]|nr:hypothetical protein [Thermoanaerobaculia bacterium]
MLRRLLTVVTLAVLVAQAAGAAVRSRGLPRSTNNDDSCDIALLPAATLLLPYFEVDLTSRAGEHTLFTIMNVTNVEQIAHVTLWTDYAFPVLDFNVYLTGYDVQSIDMYDVLQGRIAAPEGTGVRTSPQGPLSEPNPRLSIGDCANIPATLPRSLVTRVQRALTEGVATALDGSPACTRIGSGWRRGGNAIGYVTIDVVGSCTSVKPDEAAYYTGVLRYDNVLAGDYQQVNSAQNYAQGSPLVHIRAVPEDGGSVNLPRTFYGRFVPEGTKHDRRQPLPSTFAARWVDGGVGSFETAFKTWREGNTSAGATCDQYASNAALQIFEIVTFDEQENALAIQPEPGPVTPITNDFASAATSRREYGDGDSFPEFEDENAGWIYMNLSSRDRETPRQAWVVSSMYAQGIYSGDIDATALGNGCSPNGPLSTITRGTAILGPAGNVNP